MKDLEFILGLLAKPNAKALKSFPHVSTYELVQILTHQRDSLSIGLLGNTICIDKEKEWNPKKVAK